jgi:ABC-2 type transport system permease protein
MRNFYAILKKEFKSYFNLPIAYIYITVFLVLSNWLFLRVFFIAGQASMRNFFGFMPWMFLFFVPAITMRLWAEEKKLGTMEVLMTLPVRDYQVVLGKFFASFCFLILTVGLSFPLVITVAVLANPDPGVDFGPIIGSYLGVLLMGGAYLAIGLFISSLTENQIIAFIISIVVIFALIIVGEDIVLFSVPDPLVPIFDYLSLGKHFDSISRGVIDSRDLVYYFSMIGFFLYLNVRKLETGKWK